MSGRRFIQAGVLANGARLVNAPPLTRANRRSGLHVRSVSWFTGTRVGARSETTGTKARMVLRSNFTTLVFSLFVLTAPVARAAPEQAPPLKVPCLPHRTIYYPKDSDPSLKYGYRLIVYEKMSEDNDATVDADWAIEMFSRKNGDILSRTLLEWSCPAGRENCNVGPRHAPTETGYGSVDEISLDADFMPAQSLTPYAIVIPGFDIWQTMYTYGLARYGDLQFPGREKAAPDLSGSLIWVRASCVGISSDR